MYAMYAQKAHISFLVSDASLLPSFCAVIDFSPIVLIMHLPFICTTFRAWTFPAHFRPTPYFFVSLQTFIATVDRLCSVTVSHISVGAYATPFCSGEFSGSSVR
jgi:hypothetical protein